MKVIDFLPVFTDERLCCQERQVCGGKVFGGNVCGRNGLLGIPGPHEAPSDGFVTYSKES